jgi:hypothetical protein
MTRISAALAGISAEPHLRIVGEALAGRFALLAHLGADSAGEMVKLGGAKHEIGAGLADLSAIHEQADEGGLAHLAALGEGVVHGEHANAMAVAAVLNAVLHVMGCRLFVSHEWTSMASLFLNLILNIQAGSSSGPSITRKRDKCDEGGEEATIMPKNLRPLARLLCEFCHYEI